MTGRRELPVREDIKHGLKEKNSVSLSAVAIPPRGEARNSWYFTDGAEPWEYCGQPTLNTMSQFRQGRKKKKEEHKAFIRDLNLPLQRSCLLFYPISDSDSNRAERSIYVKKCASGRRTIRHGWRLTGTARFYCLCFIPRCPQILDSDWSKGFYLMHSF